jgi:hypothetical protein
MAQQSEAGAGVNHFASAGLANEGCEDIGTEGAADVLHRQQRNYRDDTHVGLKHTS